MNNKLAYNLEEVTKILKKSTQLSRNCPASDTAFSVGAIIETVDGERFTGYSRETDTINHAEEEAIEKALNKKKHLVGATLYCSLEPCSERASKELCCAQLVIQHKFARVFISEREDSTFVEDCQWVEMLQKAGIEVIEIDLET